MAFRATSRRRARWMACSRQLGKPLTAVVQLDVRYAELMRRIAGRRSCPVCGRVFNIYSMPLGADRAAPTAPTSRCCCSDRMTTKRRSPNGSRSMNRRRGRCWTTTASRACCTPSTAHGRCRDGDLLALLDALSDHGAAGAAQLAAVTAGRRKRQPPKNSGAKPAGKPAARLPARRPQEARAQSARRQ